MKYDKDKNGYPIGKVEHSDLIHRQIAYSEIYLKNRHKYPLPFSKYVVHHIDGRGWFVCQDNNCSFRGNIVDFIDKTGVAI